VSSGVTSLGGHQRQGTGILDRGQPESGEVGNYGLSGFILLSLER